MPVSFLPRLIYPALTAISAEDLRSRGIALCMLDFDNTIVPYTTDEPTGQMLEWIACMLSSGLQLCVVSNSKRDRVRRFCARYGLDCITHAKKPFSRGIRACLERYQVAPQHAALVGDQIYTDVLGANSAGLTSILVPAIDNHTIWLKLRHVAELPFCFAARKRRVQNE